MVMSTTSRRSGARLPEAVKPATAASGDLIAREAPALRRSRIVVDAVHRLAEFVARFLDVQRCGVWTVSTDGSRATCVDVYSRDDRIHRREEDREGSDVVLFHRHLDANGIIVASTAHGDAHLVPAGATAVLAVALHHGDRLVAYLSAEQTGTARPWTVPEQRFIRSMGTVMREVFSLPTADSAAQVDASLLDHLPLVAYRATWSHGSWTLARVSSQVQRHFGRSAAAFVGMPLDALRGLLAASPPPLPSEGEFEFGHVQSASRPVPRRLTEKGRVGIDPVNGSTVVEGFIVDTSASAGGAAASAAQYELLSHVSHELRTPLNAILGFAQLLQRESTEDVEQRGEYLTQIQRAGQHMLEVIQQTMDHTRLQAAPIELQLESVSLATAVAECVPLVANQATIGGVRLVNAVRDPSLRVQADRRRLSQAIVNLLSNAIKYNRRGGSVYIECQTQTRESLRLRITDTGLGLDASQIALLFQPFNRLGMERSNIEGVGLGLVITRRVIEAMGGRIEVTSQPGVGSTFEVTLPRAGG